MQLPSVLSFIPLLLSFVIQAHSHSSPPNDYIMREEINLSRRYLSIYSANGKEAYRYNKKVNFPSPGTTTIQVMDASSKILYELVPSNDECRQNSVYVQYENPSRKDQLPIREFTFESHEFIHNKWRFNFRDSSGTQQYYKFEQNLTNRGGRLYKVARGKPSQFVAIYRDQLRGDKWWNTPAGVRTFTLSSMDGGPLVEMVTLLALILNKSDDCIKERHHSTAPS
ncbi:hypothetical protein PSHT_06898 [Puccinia striiformis]|uniref:Uncharacterized protein n=1 Tax=Puccinia striiformis TaxID=27350 RepID=A0A2S4W2P3_9BASI|nr:hypothetical protein PSHT_06898 [Puccinia striiformis]